MFRLVAVIVQIRTELNKTRRQLSLWSTNCQCGLQLPLKSKLEDYDENSSVQYRAEEDLIQEKLYGEPIWSRA